MSSHPIPAGNLTRLIHTVRGQKVILDVDLARIYGVETRVLNQAVRRNRQKFPLDFLFQMTRAEVAVLRRSRSQTVILKRGQNIKYRPYAFTEHGAIMAANVLNSPRADKMSVYVVRAFLKMRSLLTEHRDLAKQLADLEEKLTKRLDVHEGAIVEVLRRIMKLLDPPPIPELKRRRIGFRAADMEE